eukprot:10983568-Lingulodinium_polyedra.AAC.1
MAREDARETVGLASGTQRLRARRARNVGRGKRHVRTRETRGAWRARNVGAGRWHVETHEDT